MNITTYFVKSVFHKNLQYERSNPFGDFAAHNLIVLHVLFP